MRLSYRSVKRVLMFSSITIMESMLVFLFLCNPPVSFIPISPSILLTSIALLLLPFFLKPLASRYISLIFLTILQFSYALVVDLSVEAWSKVPTSSIYSIMALRQTFEVILGSYLICRYFNFKYASGAYDRIIFILKIVITVQAVFSVLMLVDFNFKSYMFFEIMRYDLDDKIVSPEFFSIRGFGLANGYFFEFPVCMGIVSAILFNRFFCTNKSSDFLVALVALAVGLINARSAVIPVLVLISVSLVMGRLRFQSVVKVGGGAILIMVIAFLASHESNYKIDPKTMLWILEGLSELAGLAVGGENGNTFDNLARHQIFPNMAIENVLGAFSYIHYNGLNSDIGYVHYVYFGGFVFLGISLAPYFLIFVVSMRVRESSVFPDKKGQYALAITVLVSILLLMYKGRIILPNAPVKLIYLIYFLTTTPYVASTFKQRISTRAL